MEMNKFELISRVNFVDIKYNENGSIVTKALVGVKTKDEYKSIEVTMFGELAEQFADQVKKGEYAHFEGRIVPNEYTNKEGKTIKNIQLFVNNFDKVEFDTESKRYVVVGGEKPVVDNKEKAPWE